jgi:SAM-dependent methyltransferase
MVRNAYDDADRARAYASLGLTGTYYIAYRDLPEIFDRHVSGRRALDFGCGAGRSTRLLSELGFDVVGVDVAPDMIRAARERDPDGDYRVIADGDLGRLPARAFDLVLAAFPFDNIPGPDHRAGLVTAIGERLRPDGRFVLLASAPEIYTHEWVTFTTAAFKGNRAAGSGDVVRIVIKEGGDDRPIEDLLWLDDDYRELFRRAELQVLETHRPLGRDDEPFDWVNETRVSPWVIYVTGTREVRGKGDARGPALGPVT